MSRFFGGSSSSSAAANKENVSDDDDPYIPAPKRESPRPKTGPKSKKTRPVAAAASAPAAKPKQLPSPPQDEEEEDEIKWTTTKGEPFKPKTPTSTVPICVNENIHEFQNAPALYIPQSRHVFDDAEIQRELEKECSFLKKMHPLPKFDGQVFLDTRKGHTYLMKWHDGTWRDDANVKSVSTVVSKEPPNPALFGMKHMVNAMAVGTAFHKIVENYYNNIDFPEIVGITKVDQADVLINGKRTFAAKIQQPIGFKNFDVPRAILEKSDASQSPTLVEKLAFAVWSFKTFVEKEPLLSRKNVWRTELTMVAKLNLQSLGLGEIPVISGQSDAFFVLPNYPENDAWFNWDGTGKRPLPKYVACVDWKTKDAKPGKGINPGFSVSGLEEQYEAQGHTYKWIFEQIMNECEPEHLRVYVVMIVLVYVPKDFTRKQFVPVMHKVWEQTSASAVSKHAQIVNPIIQKRIDEIKQLVFAPVAPAAPTAAAAAAAKQTPKTWRDAAHPKV